MCSHEEMLLHTSSISVWISSFLDTRDGPVSTKKHPQQLNIFILFCSWSKLPFLQIPALRVACFPYYNRTEQHLTSSNSFPTNVILKSLYNNKWTIQYVLNNGSGSLWQRGYHIHLISFMGIHNIPLNCHQGTGCKGMRSARGAYYQGSFYDTH